MKIRLVLVLAAVAILTILFIPKTITVINEEDPAIQKPQLNTLIRGFLTSKESPLAPETEFLMQQKHWKLLIAVSAIESQYCKRQLGNNCWGVTSINGSYRKYNSIKEGIKDANDLIERWQQRGRWLTVSDMNGHYVYPYNPNWERVVNNVLQELDGLQK